MAKLLGVYGMTQPAPNTSLVLPVTSDHSWGYMTLLHEVTCHSMFTWHRKSDWNRKQYLAQSDGYLSASYQATELTDSFKTQNWLTAIKRILGTTSTFQAWHRPALQLWAPLHLSRFYGFLEVEDIRSHLFQPLHFTDEETDFSSVKWKVLTRALCSSNILWFLRISVSFFV